MNHNFKIIKKKRRIHKLSKRISFVFVIFFALFFYNVYGDSNSATWTRSYCIYNEGTGGSACNTGQTAGDGSGGCDTTSIFQAGQEGKIYCYGQSSCECPVDADNGPQFCDAGGTTNIGPFTIPGFRLYCKENEGTGSYYYDSGYLAQETIAKSFLSCSQEYDLYCYASYVNYSFTDDTANHVSVGPVAFNISWDTDQGDCDCYNGTGKWNLGGDDCNPDKPGDQIVCCCGDDAGEYIVDSIYSNRFHIWLLLL